MANVCETRVRKAGKVEPYVVDLPHEPRVVTEETQAKLLKLGFPLNQQLPLGTPIKHGLTPVCRHCGSLYVED